MQLTYATVQVHGKAGIELDCHYVLWQTLCTTAHAVSQAAWSGAHSCRHTGQVLECCPQAAFGGIPCLVEEEPPCICMALFAVCVKDTVSSRRCACIYSVAMSSFKGSLTCTTPPGGHVVYSHASHYQQLPSHNSSSICFESQHYRYGIVELGMQDAVADLLLRTKDDSPQGQKLKLGFMPTWSGASALFSPWSKIPNPTAVHPMPSWRHTDSSTDRDSEDEDEEEAPAALVEAAMLLLQDSTLAGRCSVPEEERAKQAVPPRDWEVFVQTQLQTKGSVAASSKLLAMRNAVPSPSARMVFASQVSLSMLEKGFVKNLAVCLGLTIA